MDPGSAGRSYTGSIRQAFLGLTYVNDDFSRNDMEASSRIGGKLAGDLMIATILMLLVEYYLLGVL